MNYIVRLVPAMEVARYNHDLVRVYQQAYPEPPYKKTQAEIDEFAHFLPIHNRQSGFRIAIGFDAGLNDLVGFAHGRAVEEQQPWLELVRPYFEDSLIEAWLADTFQVVEMGVDPDHQGKGLGGRLHDALLCDVPFSKAVLATTDSNTHAYKLYKSRGWIELQDSIPVPHLSRTYRLLGLDLRHFQFDNYKSLLEG